MAACAAVLVSGCGGTATVGPDDIRTYTVPREAAANDRPSAPRGGAVGTSRLRYEVPAGWSAGAASGMRLATLAIGDPAAGHEVTVIPASGTLRANVERWQRQLDADGADADIAAAVDRAIAAAEEVDVDGVKASVVALFDAAAASGADASGRAILGAVVPVDDGASLFVKFAGDAAVARRERDNFVRFVSSLRWK